MTESLQEYVDSGGVDLRVDRDAGVIHRVKLLGLASRNGRVYRERALSESAELYEKAKVNVNHAQGGPLAPRDYRDRIGAVEKVRFVAESGLFGDLHFNPKHPLAEQLIWDAEHSPQNVGFSHNVLAKMTREKGVEVVEEISQVASVDLVADPATTKGLFEQRTEESVAAWDTLTLESLLLHRPDLVQEYESKRLKEAQTQKETAVAEAELLLRRERIRLLLERYGLPMPSGDAVDAIVTEAFVKGLLDCDPLEMERLIEERAKLVRQAAVWDRRGRLNLDHPVAADQAAVWGRMGDPPVSTEAFVSSIKGQAV
ncbi:MAG: hypothetical protein AAGA92_12110 [Planctomycetota bacterium]